MTPRVCAEGLRGYFLPSRFYSREYPFTRVKSGMARGPPPRALWSARTAGPPCVRVSRRVRVAGTCPAPRAAACARAARLCMAKEQRQAQRRPDACGRACADASRAAPRKADAPADGRVPAPRPRHRGAPPAAAPAAPPRPVYRRTRLQGGPRCAAGTRAVLLAPHLRRASAVGRMRIRPGQLCGAPAGSGAVAFGSVAEARA